MSRHPRDLPVSDQQVRLCPRPLLFLLPPSAFTSLGKLVQFEDRKLGFLLLLCVMLVYSAEDLLSAKSERNISQEREGEKGEGGQIGQGPS